ncbi:hypothetical protein JW930_06135 [Candidatus Woesearchaeota archaeon]|nr:hypothetical protein [Candidatus Woesearchaeota archaeon]
MRCYEVFTDNQRTDIYVLSSLLEEIVGSEAVRQINAEDERPTRYQLLLDSAAAEKLRKSGIVGDKALELMIKTPAIRQIGARTPPWIVLAEDYFDDSILLGGEITNIRNASLTRGEDTPQVQLLQQQVQVIQQVSQYFEQHYPGIPLVVRTSAAGDAIGTGVYKSGFVNNVPAQVASTIRALILHYLSESPRAFRQDARTGEGFAVMIGPAVGEWQGDYFSPQLSGAAWTTIGGMSGRVKIAKGIGGGSKGALLVRTDLLEQYSSLYHVLDAMRGTDEDAYFAELYLKYTQSLCSVLYTFSGTLSLFEVDSPQPDDSILQLVTIASGDIHKQLGPQYFEWAINHDILWILQIADLAVTSVGFPMPELEGQLLAECHAVTGSGLRTVPQIVYVSTSEQLNALRRFNASDKAKNGYILFFAVDLTEERSLRLRYGQTNYLRYSDYSNAVAIIQYGRSIPHVGASEMTGKLFGVVSKFFRVEGRNLISVIHEGISDNYPLPILFGEFTVAASEAAGSMLVVSATDVLSRQKMEEIQPFTNQPVWVLARYDERKQRIFYHVENGCGGAVRMKISRSAYQYPNLLGNILAEDSLFDTLSAGRAGFDPRTQYFRIPATPQCIARLLGSAVSPWEMICEKCRPYFERLSAK